MLDRWELEKEIVTRALKDPAFREKFFADPKAAIMAICKEKKVPQELIKNFKIRIHEEKKNEWIINVPHILKKGEETLSNEELEKVAGGHSITSQCACC